MGVLTHAQLVTEALEKAGNTGLTLRAQTWLGLVLRHLSEFFTYPQQSGMVGTFATVAGNPTVSLGGNETGKGAAAFSTFNGRTVRGIRRIVLQETVAQSAANSNSTLETELDLITENNRRAGDVNTLGAQSTAKPLKALLSPYMDGFLATLVPTPNKAYTGVVTADVVWDALSYSAAVINAYPDDLTVMLGIEAMALDHMSDERAAARTAQFEKKVMDGRVRYGNLNPDNKKLQLSSNSFRPKAAGVTKPWDWMGRK